MKGKAILLIFLITLTFLLLGCTDPENVIRENEYLKEIFEENPNLELNEITRLSKEEFILEKDYWEENCETNIINTQYYKAEYENADIKLKVLAETSRLDLVCAIVEEKNIPIKKEIVLIECEDLDCFIDASKDCSKATWTSEYATMFEIRGLENNKCIVYRDFMKDECPFEIKDLTKMLERWKNQEFSTNDWNTC
jgi:hypothetical protein